MDILTILLVEDHAILRDGLRSLLSDEPELEVIGEAADGQAAISQSRTLKPQLVLLDLTLPNINGTEAMRAIKQENPAIKFIALTVHKSEEYVRATLDAGANGYVLKDDTHQELLTAIANVKMDKLYLSPGICDKVINGFLGHSSSASSAHSWYQLTPRERVVAKLIAEGKKSREIAECMSLALKTVEKHRANVMRKLDIHGVSELTRYAIENSLSSMN